MYRQKPRTFEFSPRLAILGAGLALAGGLALLPPDWANAIRWPLLTALEPGQRAAAAVHRSAAQALAGINDRLASGEDRARRLAEARALREENHRLRAEFRAAQLQVELLAEKNRPGDRLLVAPVLEKGAQVRRVQPRRSGPDVSGQDPPPRRRPCGRRGTGRRGDPGGGDRGRPRCSGRGAERAGRVGRLPGVGQSPLRRRACQQRLPDDRAGVSRPGLPGRPARRGPPGKAWAAGHPGGDRRAAGQASHDRRHRAGGRGRLRRRADPGHVGDHEDRTGGTGGAEARVERSPGAACWDLWVEPAADDSHAELAILRAAVNPRRIVEAAADPMRN